MQLTYALRIQPGEVVAFTGGGGKTTLLFRLAAELAAAGQRVVSTMTTHIYAGQAALAPATLALDDEAELLARLPGMLDTYGHVLVVGGPAGEPEKLRGVPPDLLDRIAALPGVDALLIEADGARRLPFKAPAAHEPVIPASTTLVVPVVGLDVLGQPLDAAHVHRPHLVAALTGALTGMPVTPAMIAAVLGHPQGGGRGVPPAARLVPFLNQAEGPVRLAAAQEIARCLLCTPRVDGVLIGAGQAADPVRQAWGRVGAVVLAAGAARRFGALKQVLPWGDLPLVAHVAAQALRCPDVARVVVTVGAEAARVRAALAAGVRRFGAFWEGERLTVVDVSDWAEGQSRSVKRGLDALSAASFPSGATIDGSVMLSGLTKQRSPRRDPSEASRVAGDSSLVPHRSIPWTEDPLRVTARGEVSAVLFLLADQPGVTPELLTALIGRHRETLAPVVAPRCRGQRGTPVLFDRATFAEFAALDGDIGARPIVQAHAGEIAWLEWDDEAVIRDIDTPQDYAGGAAHG